MLTITRQYVRQDINEVTRPQNTKTYINIFQPNVGIETANSFQCLTPEHQRGCLRTGFTIQEKIIEIQASERQVTLLLLFLWQQVALSINHFDVSRTDTDLGLVLQVRHLHGRTLRRNYLVRAKGNDRISTTPCSGTVQRPAQATVLLNMAIEAIYNLQTREALDTVILRTIVYNQQLEVGVGLF